MSLCKEIAAVSAVVVFGVVLATPSAHAATPSLADATARAGKRVTASGTAWGVDPVRGKVIVYADATVPDPEFRRITGGLAAFGGLVEFDRVAWHHGSSIEPDSLYETGFDAAEGGVHGFDLSLVGLDPVEQAAPEGA